MAGQSYSPDVARFGRFCTVVITIIVVEAIRWAIHPDNYQGRWASVVLFSVVLNVAYHIWSLPETHDRTIVSAAYNQFTMPHVGALVWVFIQTIARDAFALLGQLMPGLPL